MGRAIIAIRPEPGLSSTLDLGKELGLPIEGIALSAAEPVAWDAPNLTHVDALLTGSANVFRHGGENLRTLTHLPVYAVGQATAEAARGAGFKVAHIGTGGLQKLLDQLGEKHHFLRLAGEEQITLHPPKDVTITEKVVYRIRHLPLENAPPLPSIVLLYSASAAQHFANECARLGVDRGQITLAALGPRILAAAGSGWAGTHAPASPNDAELLALAQDLWQE